jgi:hypothetical protein
MRGHLDGHIRPRAWVGLAAGPAPASYFRLIRPGTLLPGLWAWRERPSGAGGRASPFTPAGRSVAGLGARRRGRVVVGPGSDVLRGCGLAPCRAHRRCRHRAHPVVATHPSSGRDIGRVRNADGGHAARIFAAEHNGLLWSIAASLVLPYSLFRWGAGREAGIGLGVLLTWLAVTSVADPTGAAQVVSAFGLFLFSVAPVPVGLDSSASGWGSSSRRRAVPQPRPGNPKFQTPALRPARCTARHPVRGRSVPPRGTRRFVTLWGVAANGGGSLCGVRCGRSRGPTWRPRRGFGRRAFA